MEDPRKNGRTVGPGIPGTAQGAFKGKKNVWGCKQCGFDIKTVDRDAGVAPFQITCPKCGGEAWSRFYNVDQALAPEYEWYMPGTEELATKPRGTREHCERGGLIMRKIGEEWTGNPFIVLHPDRFCLPGTHPLWSWYDLSVIHLRDVEGYEPAVRMRHEATHELALYAVSDEGQRLTPVNYSMQAALESDDEARNWGEAVYMALRLKRMHPDTDFRSVTEKMIVALATPSGREKFRASLHTGGPIY